MQIKDIINTLNPAIQIVEMLITFKREVTKPLTQFITFQCNSIYNVVGTSLTLCNHPRNIKLQSPLVLCFFAHLKTLLNIYKFFAIYDLYFYIINCIRKSFQFVCKCKEG